MDKQGRNKNFSEEHPPREQFVMFLDGELSAKESQQWQAHLSACWECRTQLGRTEETISDIMEFENVVLKELTADSVAKTDNFGSRLRSHTFEVSANKNRKRTLLHRLRDLGSRISSNMFQSRFSRMVTVSVAAILIVFTIFQLVPRTISASELLKRSNNALTTRVLSVTKPVIYQKVSIDSGSLSGVLQTWNDMDGKRTKRKSGDEAGSKEVVAQLEDVFSRNGFDIMSPLSSEKLREWAAGLQKKEERVAKVTLADGKPGYELTIEPAAEQEVGRIAKASLVFREADWHPVRGRYFVVTPQGEQVIEIAEQRFLILRGVSVKDEVFKPSE